MRIPDHARNRLSLLKAIRRWGPISRSDLLAHVPLSSGSITQLTRELLEQGVIIESKVVTTRRGRPRQNLEINPAGGVVIGASLAADGRLTTAFVDLAGTLRHGRDLHLGPQPSLERMGPSIAEALAEEIKVSGFKQEEIIRVGLGLSATVDTDSGNVHFMTTFTPKGPIAFAEPMAQRLGLPVTIENDIACMARSEHWFGRAQELDSFTLVNVGASIGLAAYRGGLPQSGVRGLNSELAHVKLAYGPDARPCFCGERGCLAAYASVYGMLEVAGELRDIPFPPVARLGPLMERFLNRAAAGDAAARQAILQAGTLLGRVLANFINVHDPGSMLLVFMSPALLAAMAEPVQRAVRENVVVGQHATEITLLVVADDWRWKGTAALAIEQSCLGLRSNSWKTAALEPGTAV